MNNVIKIKIHHNSIISWVEFQGADIDGIKSEDRIDTPILDQEGRTLLAKELIAAALELISIK